MEQSSGKKERLMLAAGLAAALALAAAQYLSPVSRAIMEGKDVRVALLGDDASALLVYHPAAGSVNAFTFGRQRRKARPDPEQAAFSLCSKAGACGGVPADGVFFVEVSSAPDLEALLGALNGWRAAPKVFFGAARRICRLSRAGATDIPAFGLFSLFSEFSGLNASDFFVEEAARNGEEADAADEDAAQALRVEVFNASGRNDLAAAATRYLRGLGFDVITASSYSSREARTSILGFSRDTSAALKLRAALDLDALEIRVSPLEKSVADAAVVLGADFDPRILGKQSGEAPGGVPGRKN
jgi:hypothetical protein